MAEPPGRDSEPPGRYSEPPGRHSGPLGHLFRIEALEPHHDREGFVSGVDALDRYLAVQAGQEVRRGFASVFVAVDATSGRTSGFYTLSMAGVAVDLLPERLQRKMPRYPSVPAVRLGRLAVANADRGRGLGKWLLLDAMARALASEVAWAAFVVDAKDAAARSFYLQYGFLGLTDDPLHLFLPRATVQAALGER
jgi:ribosomal protein S18 acetylase RimI-like enzyme